MRWDFKQFDTDVRYDIVEGVVAVRPSAQPPAEAILSLGATLAEGTPDEYFARPVLPGTIKTFRDAGWLFVEPRASVELAATERSTVPGASAAGQVVADGSGELMITTDRVVVKVSEDLSGEHALRALGEDGLIPVARLKFAPNLFEARLPRGRPLPEVIGELQEKTERYEFVDPELLQIITGRSTPSDPEFARQWQHNDGTGGGSQRADISSEGAWKLTRGAGVRIAVIDRGMQISHPDLQAGIKSGGFFPENGAERAVFIPLRPGMTGFHDNFHGTFCLGMAGARANNASGGCGSAPEADLMAIACLRDAVGPQCTLARAVAYAVNPAREDEQATPADGADVISCSLGSRGATWRIQPVLATAIKSARGGRGGLGVPIFWSVHNDDVPLELDRVCSHPDVIAVGRSDRTASQNDNRNGTAFGPKLELLAPGVEVFSTTSEDGFGSNTGTSFATPLAAGVAALVISRHRTFTAEQVRARLRESCDQIGVNVQYDANGHNDQFGFGRINAEKAVQ